LYTTTDKGYLNNNLIKILCSIDSGNVDEQPTHLSESRLRSLWSLQIITTLTESAVLILFGNSVLKNCWHGQLGMEPATLVLSHVPMTSQPQQTPAFSSPLKFYQLTKDLLT